NTLVIYTSDNGSFMYRRGDGENHHLADETDQGFRPADHTANHHWRGTKADVWEGGHRVPFFVRWPGRIRPGTTLPRPTCLTDVFATVAEAIGKPVPEGAAEDSFSFFNDVTGNRKSDPPRPGVINHSAGGMFAIRSGPWKLVLGNGSGGREKPRGKKFEKPYHLYKLSDDPGETRNLIEKHPDIAARLEAEFRKIAGDQ
ncbi:MAG: sulfatase-like hydrolase/transferase, partial [Akkermansiaceae bacterium]|nr:sulfatase-like hydrolase/transferase [Akkermansiaceae bacterium]